MCKFPLTGCLQIICKNFFAKLVQSVSFCHRLSKKLNFIKIWQLKVGQNKDLVCYRKRQSFRQCAWGLRQLVLKPGFRPKGRALGCRAMLCSSSSYSFFLLEARTISERTRSSETRPKVMNSSEEQDQRYKLVLVQDINIYIFPFLSETHQLQVER